MITIDEMNADDIAEFARIDKECFTVPWSEKAFSDEYNNGIATYFAARSDGECIGYIGFWNVGSGDITNVAVCEKYRRRGVGGMLINAVISRAAAMGLDNLTLEVRKSNTAARRLYEKYGFKAIGVRKRYYRDNNEDAIIMSRSLKEQE